MNPRLQLHLPTPQKEMFLPFGPGTPVMEGSCGQKSLAAREGCCSYEGGSRMQVLEGGGGLMSGAELTKTGLRNAAAQDGIPAHGMRHNRCHSKQQTR